MKPLELVGPADTAVIPQDAYRSASAGGENGDFGCIDPHRLRETQAVGFVLNDPWQDGVIGFQDDGGGSAAKRNGEDIPVLRQAKDRISFGVQDGERGFFLASGEREADPLRAGEKGAVLQVGKMAFERFF